MVLGVRDGVDAPDAVRVSDGLGVCVSEPVKEALVVAVTVEVGLGVRGRVPEPACEDVCAWEPLDVSETDSV